ncbi:MAG TPA: hypothetical protein VNF71_06765 [Acidimicrobiales bacterium]|nr:hypothetical protein [Acidimicrobiales bacterium]
MTALESAGGPPRDGAARQRPFLPIADALASCARGRGSLDESARRLSHEELRVARTFAGEGHDVKSVPERRGSGRTADLEVCGTPVEVKSWLALSDRRGVAPSPRSVVNKLISAEGQSAVVVLSAAGSGLSASDASAGVARYATLRPRSNISSVRVMGDGYDLSWRRSPSLELRRSAARVPGRAAERGIGIEPL